MLQPFCRLILIMKGSQVCMSWWPCRGIKSGKGVACAPGDVNFGRQLHIVQRISAHIVHLQIPQPAWTHRSCQHGRRSQAI